MKYIIRNSAAYMMEGIKSSLSHSAYTGKLMNLVRIQRYAQKWEKTLLEKEQGYILGFKWLRRYCPVPKRWEPGYIMSNISQTGYIMSVLNKGVRSRTVKSIDSLRGTSRGLADILYMRIMKLMSKNYNNSIELMLSLSCLLGYITFCNTIPHILLEVDPSLVLKPEIVQILKHVVMHDGCQPLDLDDGIICTCTQNPEHNRIGEDFQEKSLSLTDGDREKAPRHALLIAVSALMIVIMLNAATISNINNIKGEL